MRKVGVTGVGFIGLYVVEHLLEKGYEVVAFDHHWKGRDFYPEGVEVMVGDVRDRTAVTEFMAHIDGWIHLAACLGTQETIQNPYPAGETNLLGGLNILQAAAQYNVPGCYIAVGNWNMNNPYSITKNMIERFVAMYNKDRGTRVNIVRAVNAFGPRQLAAAPFAHGKVRKITPAFICRALSGMPIEIYGDGEQVSDMVWVGDVAKALVRALEHADQNDVFDRAVEIGDGAKNTVNKIATLVQALVGGKQELKHLPMRPGEIAGAEVTSDTSTLSLIDMTTEDLLGLHVGMARTVQYFRETEGIAWHTPQKSA